MITCPRLTSPNNFAHTSQMSTTEKSSDDGLRGLLQGAQVKGVLNFQRLHIQSQERLWEYVKQYVYALLMLRSQCIGYNRWIYLNASDLEGFLFNMCTDDWKCLEVDLKKAGWDAMLNSAHHRICIHLMPSSSHVDCCGLDPMAPSSSPTSATTTSASGGVDREV